VFLSEALPRNFPKEVGKCAKPSPGWRVSWFKHWSEISGLRWRIDNQ